MSLFHLQTFLCACFHDNKKVIFCSHTSHSGFLCEWNSCFDMKFHAIWKKLPSKLKIANSVIWGEWHECERLKPVWFFHLNAVQTSLWNKSHSWRKGIPLSYKQLLRSHARGPMANVSLKKICTVSRSHTMDRDKPQKLLFTHLPLNCN